MDDEKLFLARVKDIASSVRRHQKPYNTGFLDPGEQQLFLNALKNETDLRIALTGGYKEAERRVGIVFPEYISEQDLNPPIGLLIITTSGDFSRINHRDVLGAVLGLGIKRSSVGDILIFEDLAQLIVLEDMVDFISQNLVQVGKLPVTAIPAALSDIIPPKQRVKEINTTVSSLRLDAVASTAFGMSRSKILPYIKGERVMVNWKTVTKPAHLIEPGSTITIRGRGRARLEEVQGKSSKDRVKVRILRFL